MSKTLISILFILAINGTGCKTNQKSTSTTSSKVPSQETKKTEDVSKNNLEFIEYTIRLPQNELAENNEVEFYPAQMVELDCNQYALSGNMELIKDAKNENAIKYIFKNSNMIGTLMACPNTIKVMKWVRGASTFLPYNSNLPIKIQVPSNMVVKYKIWTASGLMNVKSK